MVTIKQHKKNARLYGVEYKHIHSLRILYLVTAGLLLLLLSYMVAFIFKNVSQALEEANIIVLSQSATQMRRIQSEKLHTVEAAWEQKKLPSTNTTIPNPFFSSGTTTSTITSLIDTIEPIVPNQTNL